VLHRRQRGHRHPRIALARLPAHEGEPPARAQRAAQVGEGRRRVGEEHHAEARVEAVEGGVAEVGRLRVLAAPRDAVRKPRRRGAGAGPLEHRGRDVDRQHAAALAHRLRDLERGPAAAAADVEHALARLERGARQGRGAERAHLGVEPLLHGHPGGAGGLVPVADHVGVGGSLGGHGDLRGARSASLAPSGAHLKSRILRADQGAAW
jgi:hypothetical protein